MQVILLIAVSITSLLTCGTQIDLLQNFTGNFGIYGLNSINERGYHVWIIVGTSNYNFSQQNSSTINTSTVYAIALNFSSTKALPCGEQYLYVYKQSLNATTLLTATFTGKELQSGNVLIKSSMITLVYHYVGQHDVIGIGFNATYSIKPLLNYNTTAMVRPSNNIYMHVKDVNIFVMCMHLNIRYAHVSMYYTFACTDFKL